MGIEPTAPSPPTAPLDLKSRGDTSPLALPQPLNIAIFWVFQAFPFFQAGRENGEFGCHFVSSLLAVC